MTEPISSPAGWHQDPSGKYDERWWDGAVWTQRVRTDGREYVQPFTEPREQTVRYASDDIVIAAPMSFAGSAQRIWKMTRTENTGAQLALAVLAVAVIACAWTFIVGWYLMFGVFLLPFRLIRRGQRKSNRQAAQHHEQMAMLERMHRERS